MNIAQYIDQHKKDLREIKTDVYVEESSKELDIPEFSKKGKIRQSIEIEKKQDALNRLNKYLIQDFDKPLTKEEELQVQNEQDTLQLMYDGSLPNYSKEEIEDRKNKLLELYANESLRLEAMKTIYNTAINESGFISRNIGLPAFNVINDVMNITDVGDVASLVRLGSVAFGVATGGTSLAGVLGVEAVGSGIETGADYLRAKSEGRDMSTNEIAATYGINYVSSLAWTGGIIGIQKLAPKVLSSVKNKVRFGLSKAMSIPAENETIKQVAKEVTEETPIIKTVPDVDIPGATKQVAEYTEQGIENQLQSMDMLANNPKSKKMKNVVAKSISDKMGQPNFGEELLNSTGANDGLVTKIDTVNKIITGDITDLTDEQLSKLKTKVKENFSILNVSEGYDPGFDNAAFNYIYHNYGLEWFKDKTQREIIEFVNLPTNKTKITRELRQINSSSLEKMQLSIYNRIRAIEDNIKKQVLKKGEVRSDLNKVVAVDSRATEEFSAMVVRMFKDEEDIVTDNFFKRLSTVSNGKITSLTDLIDFVEKENQGNILTYLLTGEMKTVRTEIKGVSETGEKLVESIPLQIDEDKLAGLKEFRKTFFNKRLKIDTNKFYTDDDAIVDKVREYFGGDFSDILLEDYSEETVRYYLNPNLDEFYLKTRIDVQDLVGSINANKNILPENKSKVADRIIDLFKTRGRELTQKEAWEFVRQLKKEGLLPERVKDLRNLINEGIDKQKQLGEAEDIIKKLVSNQNKYDTMLLNRCFAIYDKKEVLSNSSYFYGKDKITYQNLPLTKKEAMEMWAKQDAANGNTLISDNANKFINDYAEATGKKQLAVEREAFGMEIPSKRNPNITNNFDIRETKVLDYIKKTRDIKDFKDLSLSEQTKILNEIMFEVRDAMSRNVGRHLLRKYPGMSTREIVDIYLDKWGIKDKVKVRFQQQPANVAGYVKVFREDVDGKLETAILSLTDNPKDPVRYLGTVRHELEHLYELEYSLPMSEYATKFESFTNRPTLQGKEVLERILKGEDVTLREALGEFYNNHFYNFIDDNFEASYNGLKLAERYAEIDDYTKASLFLQSLDLTTQVTKKNKINVKALLTTNNNYDKKSYKFFEDYYNFINESPDNILDDFFVKRFQSPKAMYEFIGKITQKSNTDRIAGLNRGLLNAMRDERVGFSPNQLSLSLKSGKAFSQLEEKFGVNLSDQVVKAGKNFGQALDPMFNRTKVVDNKVTAYSLLVSGMTNNLIGFRPFKEGASVLAVNSLNYARLGETNKAIKLILSETPGVIKSIGESYIQRTADLGESFADTLRFLDALKKKGFKTSVDKTVNDFIEYGKQIDYEQTLTLRMADKVDDIVKQIRKMSETSEFGMSNAKAREVSQALVERVLLENGKDPADVMGWYYKLTSTGLRGLAADDITSNIISNHWINKEISEMFGKNSFDELSEIQKIMYRASSYTPDEFELFKRIEGIKWNKIGESYENLDNTTSNLRYMYITGKNELDTPGKVKAKTKGDFGNTMYLAKTVLGQGLELCNSLRYRVEDGVVVGSNNTLQFLGKFFKILPPLLVVAAGTYPLSIVKQSLQERKNPLELMQEDFVNLIDLDKKQWLKVMKGITETTPLEIYFNEVKSGTPLTAFYNSLTKSYKKGEMPQFLLRFYYGAYLGTLTKTLMGSGMNESMASRQAKKIIATPQGRQDFLDYAYKNMGKDAQKILYEQQYQFARDSRYLYQRGQITQQEYNDNINMLRGRR